MLSRMRKPTLSEGESLGTAYLGLFIGEDYIFRWYSGQNSGCRLLGQVMICKISAKVEVCQKFSCSTSLQLVAPRFAVFRPCLRDVLAPRLP